MATRSSSKPTALLAHGRRRHVARHADLRRDRRDDVGMRMTDRRRGEAAGEVDETVPVRVDEVEPDAWSTTSGSPIAVRGPAPSTARIRSMIALAFGPG